MSNFKICQKRYDNMEDKDGYIWHRLGYMDEYRYREAIMLGVEEEREDES